MNSKLRAYRPENKALQAFLLSHGIECAVKHFNTGSVRGWRLYNHDVQWTPELAAKLTELGFYHFATDWHPEPLGKNDGNGGKFSLVVRGHEEFLGEVPANYSFDKHAAVDYCQL